MHTIDANTQERKASEFARHGNRYYPVDKSYDKRVYENTWGNIAKIIGCLLLFWFFNALHWWAIFSLGIVDTDALVWYSIACFIFTVLFLAGLLTSGKYANATKRKHEFYGEKIAERRAEIQAAETKAEQEKAHDEKLQRQAERLAAKQGITIPVKKEEPPQPAPAESKGFIAHIQDAVSSAMAPAGGDPRLIRDDARQ